MTSTMLPIHQMPVRDFRDTAHPLILLVDDDAGIRRFVRAVLSYVMAPTEDSVDVMEAADSSEALSITRDNSRSVDLLITDIGLGPGKSGVELAYELSVSNPRMKILLISGGDFQVCMLPRGWRFLPKPFRMSELIDVINALRAYNTP